MRIINLKAENIKRLKAVEITPDGNVIKISGRNGEGKTSTLDAIWMALGGGNAIPRKPIRDGQESGRIELDLGDIIVERRFTQKGTQLVVSNRDGARFNSPQKMLDELVGRLTFDPLAFMRQDAKKQAETLKEIAGLDFSQLDRERQAAYEERTQVNREVKELKAQLAALPETTDAPAEEVDVVKLSQDLQHAHTHNQELERQSQWLASQREAQEKVGALIQDLERELQEARDRYDDMGTRIGDAQRLYDSQDPIETGPIIEQMNNAKAINAAVQDARHRAKLMETLTERHAYSDSLTDAIDRNDEEKARLIREADLPVEGLGFDEDGFVTFNGVPMDQASGAEQLKVSVAMAMSLNPKLRVLRITDASLLDSESWKVIEQMAGDGDYQVWAECVDESGTVGVVIEDGMVKGSLEHEYPADTEESFRLEPAE